MLVTLAVRKTILVKEYDTWQKATSISSSARLNRQKPPRKLNHEWNGELSVAERMA